MSTHQSFDHCIHCDFDCSKDDSSVSLSSIVTYFDSKMNLSHKLLFHHRFLHCYQKTKNLFNLKYGRQLLNGKHNFNIVWLCLLYVHCLIFLNNVKFACANDVITDHLLDNSAEDQFDPLLLEETEFNVYNTHHKPIDLRPSASSIKKQIQLLSSGLTLLQTDASRSNDHTLEIIYIPILLPIHKKQVVNRDASENRTTINNSLNGNQVQCSNEINSPAIYDLEAVLWTLDQINNVQAAQQGVAFDLLVLDTCSSPSKLVERLSNLLVKPKPHANSISPLHAHNLITFLASVSSPEIFAAYQLLRHLNVSIVSAQDISFLRNSAQLNSVFSSTNLNNLSVSNKLQLGIKTNLIQTALPLEYFAFTILQHLKQKNVTSFSVIYSKNSIQSASLFDSLGKLIVSENNEYIRTIKSNSSNQSGSNKSFATLFCISTVINVNVSIQSHTGEASKALMQLKKDLELSNTYESTDNNRFVLLLTESSTTREIFISYQHLIHAGIYNKLNFMLIKESNLNIVSNLESSLVDTVIVRENQKSLKDFIEYFEDLKPETNIRNPFFTNYWQQISTCSTRDCLVDQIDPINTVNTIQSTFAVTNSLLSIRQQLCANNHRNDCGQLFSNNIDKLCTYFKQNFIRQTLENELQMHKLSKHFNHVLRFTQAGYPAKGVDVLKFKHVHQIYRFDRISTFFSNFRTLDLSNEPSVSYSLFYCNRLSKLNSVKSTYGVSSMLSISDQHSNELVLTMSSVPLGSIASWKSGTAVLSFVGLISVIICLCYFLITFNHNVGTTLLGYMILIGVLLLFLVNFLFLFPLSFLICWLRCFLMGTAYSVILSGMLMKVMNSWRLNGFYNVQINLSSSIASANQYTGFHGNYIINNFNTHAQNPQFTKLSSPTALLFMSIGLVILQALTNLIWLTIYPPRAALIGNFTWKCYNNQISVLIETDSIISVLFTTLLLLITMFFSVLTWKYSINNYESRWILFSCYVIITTWIIWAFLSKLLHLAELRDISIALSNLIIASTILICLYIRKLLVFFRLSAAANKQSTSDHDNEHKVHGTRFGALPSLGAFYGSILQSTGASSSRVNKKNDQNNRKSSVTSNLDNLDNVSTISAITTTSSIVSSVKSYFKYGRAHSKDYNQEHQSSLDRNHLSGETELNTMDSSSYNCTQIRQGQNVSNSDQQGQHELYPMDVYEAGTLHHQPSSMFAAKSALFNSNRSLYLMDEKMFI